MTATQALMLIMQQAARQGNDQVLGEWIRKFISELKLVEENQSNGNRLLKG